MRAMAAKLGWVLSVVMVVMGILVMTGALDALDFSGSTASNTSFGADFYTYSYRATRYAANNVDSLGDFVQQVSGLAMIFAGAAGALLSMYGLGAAKESEQKKELLQALLEKKNEPVVIVKEAPRAEENQANTTF